MGLLVETAQGHAPITISVAPKTIVVFFSPYRLTTERHAQWVVADIVNWDNAVDMSWLGLDPVQCTEYVVRAVV